MESYVLISNNLEWGSMKFKSWFWNWRDILSNSSIQIIFGLFSSSTSKILLMCCYHQNTRRFLSRECLIGIRSLRRLVALQKAGCNSRPSLTNFPHAIWNDRTRRRKYVILYQGHKQEHLL
jgi:hypothetical protein